MKAFYGKTAGSLLLIFASINLCACTSAPAEMPAIQYSAAPVAYETALPECTPGMQISFAASTPAPVFTFAPVAAPTDVPTIALNESETKRELTDEHEKYCAPEGVSTVAWISDTQHYANTFPEIYPTITSFLAEYEEELHLAYVIHTGDLVHQCSSEENWKRAYEAMNLLDGIPCGVLAGNHDVAKKNGKFDNYCRYFGEKFYSDKPWYGESFENNRGHYDLITIGDSDYIFVYMSFEPDEKALEFIKDAFDRYPDRIGILCLHDFIKTDGTLSKDGIRIREKILNNCHNCYMVLCGHRYGFYCLTDQFDDNGDGAPDRNVYEIMANYQAVGKEGGSGYFKLLQFNDDAGTIYFMSYSPYLNDYNWLDDPGNKEPRYMMDVTSEEFELKMPWKE